MVKLLLQKFGAKQFAVLGGALVLLTACGGTTGTGSGSNVDWKSAKAASDGGGMSALVDAAKKEGKLNIIAVPPDWANYGAIWTTWWLGAPSRAGSVEKLYWVLAMQTPKWP